MNKIPTRQSYLITQGLQSLGVTAAAGAVAWPLLAQYQAVGYLSNFLISIGAVGCAHLAYSLVQANRLGAAPRALNALIKKLARGEYNLTGQKAVGLHATLANLGLDLGKQYAVVQARQKKDQRDRSELNRLRLVLDRSNNNVMVADAQLNILYINRTGLELFQRAQPEIRKQLPDFDANQLVGSNIDRFHRHPAHQRGLLSHLTGEHKASLEVGGFAFGFTAQPLLDEGGEHLGFMVEWVDRSSLSKLATEISSVADATARGDLSKRLGRVDDGSGGYQILASRLNELMGVFDRVVKETGSVLKAMSEGDLTQRVEGAYQGAFAELKEAINTTSVRLADAIGQFQGSAAEIKTGAAEIAQGNMDLSRRTEEQGANLEITASSMEEITTAMRQNAENANHANELAAQARGEAEKGGQVVTRAVAAMAEINTSSKQIADIIGVIDEIAFQTNLLALNAAVEAAHAGDHGRGFAVVANEVRNLAQRSAAAAREIKALIQDSVQKVQDGTQLVNDSGTMLGQIVASVKRVSDIISEIASANLEQSAGIEQVNRAVNQLDKVTQQNAALVEQSAAASETLLEQANQIESKVAYFRVGPELSKLLPAPRAIERRSAKRPWSNASSAAPAKALPGGTGRAIDFVSARAAHLSWKTRLRRFLNGEESMSSAQASSSKECDLGKWLYSTGLPQFGDLPEMRQMEKRHAELHQHVGDVIRFKHSGNADQAERAYEALSRASDDVIKLLTTIEDHISEKESAAPRARAVGDNWEQF